MKKRIVLLAAALVVSVTLGVQADKKKAGFDATCPVANKPAKKSQAVAHNGGEVYFCCGNCVKAFKANTAKFATKANHQLAATGQAQQVGCPIAGKKVNPSTAIDVGGVSVAFCCGGCKSKASKAEGDAQLDLVFSEKAFAKGFKVANK